MYDNDSLGAFLRHRRERVERLSLGLPTTASNTFGLTRRELASLSGVSESFIEKVERGGRRMTAHKLDRLLKALRASPDELVHAYRLAGLAPNVALTEGVSMPPGTALYLDALDPNPAAYMDLAWTILYANPAFKSLFTNVEQWGNLMVWLFRCPEARRLLGEWDVEAHAMVRWSRELRALTSVRPMYDAPLSQLEDCDEFSDMWDAAAADTGNRGRALQRIVDRRGGQKREYLGQWWSPPDMSAGYQLYLGTPSSA